MAYRDIMRPQFNWPPQVVEHFGSRGYQPVKEADNVTHTILTPEESTVPDEIRERLYSILPLRFWTRTDLTDTCWLWTGGKHQKGYGSFWWQGDRIRAHRLVWSILFGEIPAGMMVCHKCDNPPCFNPSHLFLGTNGENQADSHRKGRHNWQTTPPPRQHGEEKRNAKLTDKAVREIKIELANGVTERELAGRYSIDYSTIHRIKKGKRWAHVTIDSDDEQPAESDE